MSEGFSDDSGRDSALFLDSRSFIAGLFRLKFFIWEMKCLGFPHFGDLGFVVALGVKVSLVWDGTPQMKCSIRCYPLTL